MSDSDPWSSYVDQPWLDRVREQVIEPQLAITDPHHHLWSWPFKYGIDETLADFTGGHRIRATVHVEAHGHYRTDGPEHLRPVGETEFIATAAQTLAGRPGAPQLCAGIVGHVDVLRGADVDEVLEAHIQASGGRFRGIRVNLYWTMYADRPWAPSAVSSLIGNPAIASALGRLARYGLSCDLVAFHPNLADIAKTAASFEDTLFVVNHMGAPMASDPNADPAEVVRLWRQGVAELAKRPNVRIKLGGCANPMLSRALPRIAALKDQPRAPTSVELAEAYRPYVEYCIEQLGPARCMFESNFPAEKNYCSLVVLWNAYKNLAARYSPDERTALLGGTAAATYRV